MKLFKHSNFDFWIIHELFNLARQSFIVWLYVHDLKTCKLNFVKCLLNISDSFFLQVSFLYSWVFVLIRLLPSQYIKFHRNEKVSIYNYIFGNLFKSSNLIHLCAELHKESSALMSTDECLNSRLKTPYTYFCTIQCKTRRWRKKKIKHSFMFK